MCWGLIGVCGTSVVCAVLGDVVGRGEGLRWVDDRIFAWGVMWVGMSGSCDVVVVSWCETLGLMGPRVSLWMGVVCCGSGGMLVLVGFLLGG